MRLFGKIFTLLWMGLFASGVVLAQEPSSSASPPAIEPPPSLDVLTQETETADRPFWQTPSMADGGVPEIASMEQLMLAFADGLVPNLADENQRKAFVAYLRTRFGDPTRRLPDRGLQQLQRLQAEHPELFWPVEGEEAANPRFANAEAVQTNYSYPVPDDLRLLIDTYLDAADGIRDLILGAESMRGFWLRRLTTQEQFDAIFTTTNIAQDSPWIDFYTNDSHSFLDRMRLFGQSLFSVIQANGSVSVEGEVESHAFLPNHPGHEGLRELIVGVAHAVGFASPALRRQMRSDDGMEALQALRTAISLRDEFVYDLLSMSQHNDGFARLRAQVTLPTEMVIFAVGAIDDDAMSGFSERATSERVATGSRSRMLRQMSPIERFFRSLVGGSDCSSYTYFLRPPNFIYYTWTDESGRSDSQITIVLGSVSFADGRVQPAAFIDKIQNVSDEDQPVMIEGIRRSLARGGVTLVAVGDVGELIDVLSNETHSTDYFNETVLATAQEAERGVFSANDQGFSFPVSTNYSNTRRGAVNVVVVPALTLADGEEVSLVRATSLWSAPSLDLDALLRPLIALREGTTEQRLRYVTSMQAFAEADFPTDPDFETVTDRWLADEEVSFRVKYTVMSAHLLADEPDPLSAEERELRREFSTPRVTLYSARFLERFGSMSPSERSEAVSNWLQTPRFRTEIRRRSGMQLVPLVAHREKTLVRVAAEGKYEGHSSHRELGVYAVDYTREHFGAEAAHWLRVLIANVVAPALTDQAAALVHALYQHVQNGGPRGLAGLQSVCRRWLVHRAVSDVQSRAFINLMILNPERVAGHLRAVPEDRRATAIATMVVELHDHVEDQFSESLVPGAPIAPPHTNGSSGRFLDWLADPTNTESVRRLGMAFWLVRLEESSRTNGQTWRMVEAGFEFAPVEAHAGHLDWLYSGEREAFASSSHGGIFGCEDIHPEAIRAFVEERTESGRLSSELLLRIVSGYGEAIGGSRMFAEVFTEVAQSGGLGDSRSALESLYQVMIDTPVAGDDDYVGDFDVIGRWLAQPETPVEVRVQTVFGLMTSGTGRPMMHLGDIFSHLSEPQRRQTLVAVGARVAAMEGRDDRQRLLYLAAISAEFWNDMESAFEEGASEDEDRVALTMADVMVSETTPQQTRTALFMAVASSGHGQLLNHLWSYLPRDERSRLLAISLTSPDLRSARSNMPLKVFCAGLRYDEFLAVASRHQIEPPGDRSSQEGEAWWWVREYMRTDEREDQSEQRLRRSVELLDAFVGTLGDYPQEAGFIRTLLQAAASTPEGAQAGISFVMEPPSDLPSALTEQLDAHRGGREFIDMPDLTIEVGSRVFRGSDFSRLEIQTALNRVMVSVPRSTGVNRVQMLESIRTLALW